MNHFDFVPFQEILSATNEDQLIGKFDVSISMIHCCRLFVALLFDFCSFIIDVIGHVVEKNDMKETEKNGKISKLMDAVLEDLE
jgi:hypothetical protein